MRGFLRIVIGGFVGVVLLGWAPDARAQESCRAAGSITQSGNPVPDGGQVTCDHSGGTSYVETLAGHYECVVDPGAVTISYQYLPRPTTLSCPDHCKNGEDIGCNMDLIVECGRPTVAPAVVFPLALYRRRRRRRLG